MGLCTAAALWYLDYGSNVVNHTIKILKFLKVIYYKHIYFNALSNMYVQTSKVIIYTIKICMHNYMYTVTTIEKFNQFFDLLCSAYYTVEVGWTFAPWQEVPPQHMNSRLSVLTIVIPWQAELLVHFIVHLWPPEGQVTVASWQELAPPQLIVQETPSEHIKSSFWQALVVWQLIVLGGRVGAAGIKFYVHVINIGLVTVIRRAKFLWNLTWKSL